MDFDAIRTAVRTVVPEVTQAEIDAGIALYEATNGETLYHPFHFIAAACNDRDAADAVRGLGK